MGRISLIRISGARLTLRNTPDGPGFLEIRSHEKGPTYCVISSSVSLFRPAGSSLEIRYAPLFLLFSSQICQCTKEAHEKKQLHGDQRELLALQI